MTNAQHAEWLSLLDISGPFLSPPVLDRVFPQGLEVADPDHTAKLRLAYEEWAEEKQKPHPDPAIHDAWIRLVLTETLGLTPGVLLEGDGIPSDIAFTTPEHGATVRPDFVVFDAEDEPRTRKPRLLISVWSPETGLDQPIDKSRWTASPIDRMIALCRAENVELRLGMVTNGERWVLVDAPIGETSAHASWYASLWGQEPLTLRAFRSLLGLRRFFGVAEDDRLEAMLVESTNYQTDVTDQLGFQVRRAVEVLVHAIDRADADSGRTLLADTYPARIYEAALTVMMRLVFLFSAEERGLLRLGDPMYDQFYAVSTLRAQLREAADQVGEEVLERRQDAWSRLLGTFRAIYAGVHHEALQIIPYGSSLFDPDRFPFLEGRPEETSWRETESAPLPIDNRTVLLLLESLQLLDLGPGKGARKLSFRALDIEQIGHVYETLLDHSAYRATEPMVSLQGNQGREPEILVSKLHELVLHDDAEGLIEFLKAELKKGVSPIRKALKKTPEPEAVARLRSACGGDEVLLAKLLPFHDLIRLDPWGDPVVIREGAVFVTAGEDRRSTGTHYTPRALTEEIVQHALEPIVYRGPAEGRVRDEWELMSPSEILALNVCDPAMGSGAFLVQTCRYLSERLVEAWELAGTTSIDTSSAQLIPTDPEERSSLARRLVANRCLYGVDVNPLAVEMAKLSMWLVTLARDAAFTFLDHALKCGDSLLGVHTLDQIRHFHPMPHEGEKLHRTLFDPTRDIEAHIGKAVALREALEAASVNDVYDAQVKGGLHAEANKATYSLKRVGDLLIGATISTVLQRKRYRDAEFTTLAELAAASIDSAEQSQDALFEPSQSLLQAGKPKGRPTRRTFHWPLEFPEVFERSGGFDAFVSNPPFLGGLRITELLGDDYNTYLARSFPPASKKVDLSAFFYRRCATLLRPEGVIGMLGTNTISQGTTRKGGLEPLVEEGFDIFRAEKSFKWPGSASIHAAQVYLYAGEWSGERVCSKVRCAHIGSLLEPQMSSIRFPERLSRNAPRCMQGSTMRGKGFFLTDEEARAMLARDSRNRRVIKPAIGGRELNTEVPIKPTRWAIDFGEMDFEEASSFEAPFAHVQEYVKPDRDGIDPVKYSRITEAWWKYWHGRLELYRGLGSLGLTRVLARSRVSAHHMVAFLPNGFVYTDALIMYLYDDYGHFGAIQSAVHEAWATKYQSSLGAAPRYIATDCFHTFPLPESGTAAWESLREAGEAYYTCRETLMAEEKLGLGPVYSRLHDARCLDSPISELRDKAQALNAAMLASYGFDDIDPYLVHRHTDNGERFSMPPPIEAATLLRLLELNHERASLQDG